MRDHKLPSERARESQEKKNEEQKKVENYREIMTRIFQTDDGKALFKWLSDQCGFTQNNLILEHDGTVSLPKISYNEGRRDLYLSIRKFIHRDVLIELEKKTTEY